MAKNLVIVESPSKSKTIEKYLGGDYKVVSSKGIYIYENTPVVGLEKDKDGYYVNETENGSGVWITDEDIHNDFDVEEE